MARFFAALRLLRRDWTVSIAKSQGWRVAQVDAS